MRESNRYSRREFLQIARSGVATWVTIETLRALPTCAMLISLPESSKSTAWRAFTPLEGLTVQAVTTEIIPSDRDAVGASEIKVASFIDTLASGSQLLKKHYITGIISLDKSSVATFRRPFLELVAAERRDVIRTLAEDKAPKEAWTEVGAKEFFSTIRYHTVLAYYTDSRVFSAIGFPGPGAYFDDVGEPNRVPVETPAERTEKTDKKGV